MNFKLNFKNIKVHGTGLGVAVGIPVTRDPPHRSVRALLAHTAPVSDDGGEAFLRPRVKNAGLG